MKLLLDTHIWVWSLTEPERLAPKLKAELSDPVNELWLSPVSLWELVFLVERNRIRLVPDPHQFARDAIGRIAYRQAVINYEIMLESHRMNLPHRDPADRILAATALVYDLTLVTADRDLLNCRGLSVLPNQ